MAGRQLNLIFIDVPIAEINGFEAGRLIKENNGNI